MTTKQALVKALNLVLIELREVSQDNRTNNFDHIMKQLTPEVREHITINTSPVYWDENEYDPRYCEAVARNNL